MAGSPAVSDAQITRALGAYAAMVERVLSDPQRWLGLDEDPPPTAPFPARALDALRDRALGETTPASARWGEQPLDRRVDWWVTRIGISAGLAAAAPRLAGALADRVPLQAALGASAAGLAVCATAREHGRTAPADWVPLLAQVLFDRHLPAAEPLAGAEHVPTPGEAEEHLATGADEELGEGDGGRAATLSAGARRAAGTLWRLGRAFFELHQLLEERPRGNLLTRTLGKLPVVGVAGGWLDERAGIREAARRTGDLLRRGPGAPRG
ncbi:hypothetical protein [Kineococcus gypseus]|uniref:hypothetical protein n=1 Tax=Kineococcus gypseus TaxID=1637102 RepID=UPI003D7DB561